MPGHRLQYDLAAAPLSGHGRYTAQPSGIAEFIACGTTDWRSVDVLNKIHSFTAGPRVVLADVAHDGDVLLLC